MGAVNDDSNNDDLRRTGNYNAPIGHSWDLVDRRVIELWLGSQSDVPLPRYGPAKDLGGLRGATERGT